MGNIMRMKVGKIGWRWVDVLGISWSGYAIIWRDLIWVVLGERGAELSK